MSEENSVIEEIKTHDFSKALTQLNIKDLNQVKNTKFTHENEVHREILNYIIRKLPNKNINTERDYINLGFESSSEIISFFNDNNGILLSLELLFLHKFEVDIFDSKCLKDILLLISQINQRVKFDHISDYQEFFVMFLSVYKKLKNSKKIEDCLNVENCFNEMILNQIKGKY